MRFLCDARPWQGIAAAFGGKASPTSCWPTPCRPAAANGTGQATP